MLLLKLSFFRKSDVLLQAVTCTHTASQSYKSLGKCSLTAISREEQALDSTLTENNSRFQEDQEPWRPYGTKAAPR